MPFALLIIGVVLLVSAVRDTSSDLFTLIKGDFSGDANFIFWVVSLLVIGAMGYVPKLKPLSDAFLVLLLLVLFLAGGNPNKVSGGGLFKKFTDALNSTKTKSGNTTTPVSNSLTALPQLPSLGVV